MKSTYIFRGNEEEIEISFNMEHEEIEDIEMAWDFLCKILKESEDEVKNRFYLDEVLDIEEKYTNGIYREK